jgi:hypothetical protein
VYETLSFKTICTKPVDTVVVVVPPPVTPELFQVAPVTAIGHPGSGIEQWHDQNATSGLSGTGDIYLRTGLEADEWYSGTTFTVPQVFINNLQEVKRRGAKLSFGIMTFNGTARIPSFIWNKMDKWSYQGRLIPNWNDPIYLAWVADHCKKINDWIYANGWQDQIGTIDIRHYGSWGEWNIVDITNDYKLIPSGKHLTAASGILIVRAYVEGFPNFQLVTMIATHDRFRLPNVWVDPAISAYALNASNNYGKLGYRWDAIGSGDSYPKDWIANADPNRWKLAPVNGEPIGNTSYMGSIVTDVAGQHVNALGNGNPSTYPSSVQTSYRTASASMGYTLKLTGGTIATGNNWTVKLNWNVSGLVPIYEKWQLLYEFRKNGTIIAIPSSWSPRLLYGNGTSTDVLPTPLDGYELWLRVAQNGRKDLLNIKIK